MISNPGDGGVLKDQRTRVIAVVGATGTGKTSLGVELATRFRGEVVNADSRLFYRGMDIGTAKPTDAERRGVEHHLIDVLDPQDGFSLNEFLGRAKQAISDIRHRDKLPVLVGGSGQYVWGLLEGWQVPEIPPDPGFRAELESQLDEEGIESLQRRLLSIGASNVEQVEIMNPRRLIRAIERAEATGDAMGGASKADVAPYDALVIGLNAEREILQERVAARVDEMFAAGWKEEVKALMDAGADCQMPSMSAIGYRQMMDLVEGHKTWETVREEILIGNHRLIGAQHNWFKPRDARINWLDITEQDYVESAVEIVDVWLG